MKKSNRQSADALPFGLFLGLVLMLTSASAVPGQAREAGSLWSQIDAQVSAMEQQVISWRRDIHQHPELSNREFRTARMVADHLQRLNIEVRTEVAHTGVVGVLRGGKAGPVVALRADMDALPVTEEVDLPFASTARAVYNGEEVGVMHACGHDAHTAMLMGVAQVLAALRDDLPGTVKFIFQPAEEGTPQGEEGGADLMIREGVLQDPKPEAIFGLHVFPSLRVGKVAYRSGPMMASSDGLHILVRGRQTHGAVPWGGVDPIVVSCQIILGLQTIVSRQTALTAGPAIVSIGSIHGGVRGNIIPDEVRMVGTIRTFDPDTRRDIHERIRRTARMIAQSAGATAEVTIDLGNPVTINDPKLTERIAPILERVAGKGNVFPVPPLTVSEDFACYQQQIPGLYFYLGVTPEDADPNTAPMLHSPRFRLDEGALAVGMRSLAHLAVACMEKGQR